MNAQTTHNDDVESFPVFLRLLVANMYVKYFNLTIRAVHESFFYPIFGKRWILRNQFFPFIFVNCQKAHVWIVHNVPGIFCMFVGVWRIKGEWKHT